MPSTNTNVPATFHDLVTAVRTSTEGPLYALGMYREEDGRGYRYVQFDNGSGNVAALVGGLAYILNDVNTVALTTGAWTVTMDVSDTSLSKVRGVFVAIPADLGYCWIQTKGPATVLLNNDDDAVKGQSIIATSSDGLGDTVAVGTAPTHRVVGWCLGSVVAASNLVPADMVLE